jgi:hypothetical protein
LKSLIVEGTRNFRYGYLKKMAGKKSNQNKKEHNVAKYKTGR